MSLRILFAGTPEFAVSTLQALIDSEHEVVAVYTQPDRPAGRGRKVAKSPVKELAEQHLLTVLQPNTMRDAEQQRIMDELEPDVMIVVAYGLLLPPDILSAPKYGCLNVHASLLPRWRGAAPIQYAILHGDKKTGVTIMQMDQGLDTGDMLLVRECDIKPDDSSADLHDRLATMGADALLETLQLVESHQLKPVAQEDAHTTYARKIQKIDAQIHWQKTSEIIINQIRAFNPWPVAFAHFDDQPLRIWQAKLLSIKSNETPGTLIAFDKEGIDIATENGAIRVLELQLPGGKRLQASDFINAHRDQLIPGKTLFL